MVVVSHLFSLFKNQQTIGTWYLFTRCLFYRKEGQVCLRLQRFITKEKKQHQLQKQNPLCCKEKE